MVEGRGRRAIDLDFFVSLFLESSSFSLQVLVFEVIVCVAIMTSGIVLESGLHP